MTTNNTTKTDIEKMEAIAEILDFDWSDHETDDDTLHEQYDEMLNECYDTPKVGNCEMAPSAFMKTNDPTAYRCGFSDWLDSESDRLQEIAGIYVDSDGLTEAKEAIAELINELE